MTSHLLPALLVLGVALPALGALAVGLRRSVSGRFVARATCASAILMSVVAVAAWWEPVAAAGPSGLRVDRVGSLMVVLVSGVAAVVVSFAQRSLRGEPYLRRFNVWTGVLTTASAVVVTAASMVTLTLAWLVVSASVVALVRVGGTRDAVAAARRTRRALAVGDVALVGAAVLTTTVLSDPLAAAGADAEAATGGWVPVAALLLVVAAVTRSALVPAHGWLAGTVWAPTPVSALLHAGVVNAGGLLLLRTWSIVGAVAWVLVATLLLGTATVVVGTLRSRARGDVKGALADSTVGQMGFMVVVVALGAHGAALLHLVAHGMFKASLFLGSGTAVALRTRAVARPRSFSVGAGWHAAALAVPALAVAPFALSHGTAAWSVPPAGELLVAACVVLAVGAAVVAGLHRSARIPVRLELVAVGAVAAAAYLVAVHAVTDALAPALADPGTAVPGPVWLVPVAVAMAATAALLRGLGGHRTVGLRTRVHTLVAAPAVRPLSPHAQVRSRRLSGGDAATPGLPAHTPAGAGSVAREELQRVPVGAVAAPTDGPAGDPPGDVTGRSTDVLTGGSTASSTDGPPDGPTDSSTDDQTIGAPR